MTSLKSVLLGATVLMGAGAISAANAADIYKGGGLKDESGYVPAITWAGFYAGVQAGSVFGDEFTFERNDTNELVVDIDDTWLVGAHLGYNWQRGTVVFGVEGDWSYLGGDRGIELDDLNTTGLQQDDNWLASVRGRLGYATGSTLLYATAGVAFLHTTTDFVEDLFDVDIFSDTSVGFVAGVGVEHKFTPNVSLGLEGLSYSFDEVSSLPGFSFERDLWSVRGRVSYHFDRDSDESLK
jgi:outer membrane immunogenic protein